MEGQGGTGDGLDNGGGGDVEGDRGQPSSAAAAAAPRAAAEEALRLLVSGTDLFYPAPKEQARLLLAYLEAWRVGGSLLPAGQQLVSTLLLRLTSPEFLSELEEAEEGASGGDEQVGVPQGKVKEENHWGGAGEKEELGAGASRGSGEEGAAGNAG
ncbi:unnamed protein product, partial [Discosporangium mesarthrocarpum]